MPREDFERWLNLLASLLDLDAEQREAIREELWDHLEERLAELERLGVPREEAIERALEEFGDAAGLAGSFTKLARETQRRRRLAMYRTTASALAVTALLLVSVAFWPQNQPAPLGGAPVAVAQGFGGNQGLGAADPGAGIDRPGNVVAPSPAESRRAKVEAGLDVAVEVEFIDTPFDDAVDHVAEAAGVDIVVDETALDDVGFQLETPTSLRLRYAKPSARSLLELVLERHGLRDELALVARDGYAIITAAGEDALEVEVYDVRDLVEHGRAKPADEEGAEGGAGAAHADGDFGGSAMFQGGAFGGGGGPFGDFAPPPADGVDGLVNVITTTISPSAWDDVGGPGSVAAFEGLLVVRNSGDVHRRVEALLSRLRAVRAQPVPAGGGRGGIRPTR